MQDDQTTKGQVTSKPNNTQNQQPNNPKSGELGRIVERSMPYPSGTKKDGTTNSTGPKKPS